MHVVDLEAFVVHGCVLRGRVRVWGVNGTLAHALLRANASALTLALRAEDDGGGAARTVLARAPVSLASCGADDLFCGAFAFVAVMPGARYRVSVDAPHGVYVNGTAGAAVHASWTCEADAASADVLIGGFDVRGVALSDGGPVANLPLILYWLRHDNMVPFRAGGGDAQRAPLCTLPWHPLTETSQRVGVCETLTLADGTFAFGDVTPGVYEVVPFAKREQVVFAIEPPLVGVTVNGPVDVGVFRVAIVSASGVVLDDAGRGIAGAAVLIDGRLAGSVTDELGCVAARARPRASRLRARAHTHRVERSC